MTAGHREEDHRWPRRSVFDPKLDKEIAREIRQRRRWRRDFLIFLLGLLVLVGAFALVDRL